MQGFIANDELHMAIVLQRTLFDNAQLSIAVLQTVLIDARTLLLGARRPLCGARTSLLGARTELIGLQLMF